MLVCNSMWLVLQPPTLIRGGFGLIPVRSPLLGEYSLFLQVLRCFNSLRSLVHDYRFIMPYQWFALVGYPIRKSGCLVLVDSFTRRIAACRVLLRSELPRHPPCALRSFVFLRQNHSASHIHRALTFARRFYLACSLLLLMFNLSAKRGWGLLPIQSFCSEISTFVLISGHKPTAFLILDTKKPRNHGALFRLRKFLPLP